MYTLLSILEVTLILVLLVTTSGFPAMENKEDANSNALYMSLFKVDQANYSTALAIIITTFSITFLLLTLILYLISFSNTFLPKQGNLLYKLASTAIIIYQKLLSYTVVYSFLLSLILFKELTGSIRVISLILTMLSMIILTLIYFLVFRLFNVSIPTPSLPWASFSSNIKYLRELVKIYLLSFKMI